MVTSTKDTEGVSGETSSIQYTQDKVGAGQTKDTTGPMGETEAQTHRDPTAIFPDQGATKDTEAVQGDHHSVAKDDPTQYLTGTLDTQTGGGSPRQDAARAYRAPKNAPAVTTTKDTTRTDQALTSHPTDTFVVTDEGQGYWNDSEVLAAATHGNLTQNFDTINPHYPMQTSTVNTPATPGSAPSVLAKHRAVDVTITHVSDPTGAKIRGYRIENSLGGTAFIGRDAYVCRMTTLVPSQPYKFRFAAVNDNGIGHWSAWSVAATPTNPDEPGPGHPTTVTVANRLNPIYSPAGTVKPGTGGTAGPVGSPAAAANSNSGELVITWTAPTWGNTITGYKVTLSTGETFTTGGSTLTKTFTGLSIVARTATITPINARGNGVPATTGTATPHA